MNLPKNLPQAARIQIFWCGDTNCGRPHVVLFDERDSPIASFVTPIGWSQKLWKIDNQSKPK